MRIPKNYYTLIILLSGIIPMPMQCMELKKYIKEHTYPIQLKAVQGLLENQYAIVETVITVPPTADEKTGKAVQLNANQLAASSKIRRQTIGMIGGTSDKSESYKYLPDDFKMRVPSTLFDPGAALEGIPELVTKAAGAVDPQAGAVAAVCAATYEITMQMMTKGVHELMGKAYDAQETEMTLLELIPTKYYEIIADDNTIGLKPAFKKDIVAYNNDYQRFSEIAERYNNLLKEYNRRATEFNSKYPWGIPKKGVSDAEKTEYNALSDMKESQVQPLLKEVLGAMLAMQRYGMHRIAIMAINTKPGSSCPESIGPLFLYIYYFLGARLTNIFKVPYCVKQRIGKPYLIVNISPNDINRNTGEFKQGGVRFIACDNAGNPATSPNDTIITFPMKIGIGIVPRTESALYSWWDQIFSSSEEYGKSTLSYMFPYDIYSMDKLKQEIARSQQKEAVEKANKFLDQGIEYLKTSQAKKEMETPKTEPTAKPEKGKSMIDKALSALGLRGGKKPEAKPEAKSEETKPEEGKPEEDKPGEPETKPEGTQTEEAKD